MSRRLIRWWTADLEPLQGPLRLIFYSVLLGLALAGTYRSPLAAVDSFATTDPLFYTPQGLFEWTGVGWVTPGLLAAVRAVTIAAWVCAAIGLLGRWSPLLAGVGFFFLHGIVSGAVGITHRWYIPVYAMLALSLAADDGRWSLDGWLARRFGWYPRAAPPPLWRTGFARKLILLCAVSTLFCGGVSKLLGSGPAWMDGLSLQFYVASQAHYARWPWLAEQITSHLWLSAALSIGTIALELAAPLALFSRRARHVIVVLALGFHLGIYLVMHPFYWYQMWCYPLLIDWGRILAWLRRSPAAPTPPDEDAPSLRAGAALGTAVCALLLAVGFLRIEWWPLSHIPMYSDYMGPADSWSTGVVRDEAQAHLLARRCQQAHACAWSPDWFDVYLLTADWTAEPLSTALDAEERDTGVFPKQLFRSVRRVVSADLIAKHPGPVAHDPDEPDHPGRVWLRHIAPVVRREVEDVDRYEWLVLIAQLRSGPVVIAAEDL